MRHGAAADTSFCSSSQSFLLYFCPPQPVVVFASFRLYSCSTAAQCATFCCFDGFFLFSTINQPSISTFEVRLWQECMTLLLWLQNFRLSLISRSLHLRSSIHFYDFLLNPVNIHSTHFLLGATLQRLWITPKDSSWSSLWASHVLSPHQLRHQTILSLLCKTSCFMQCKACITADPAPQICTVSVQFM